MSQQTFSFSIDLPVRNEWKNVDLVRTSVQNCFAAVFADIDGCNALSMVTGELLENAMKYGLWKADDPSQTFRLQVNGGKELTRVIVENPVNPDAPGLSELFKTLEWIRGFDTPAEAYRARLLEIASAEDDPSKSKLGLVRIAYEGNCSLSAEVEGATLSMVAELRLVE